MASPYLWCWIGCKMDAKSSNPPPFIGRYAGDPKGWTKPDDHRLTWFVVGRQSKFLERLSETIMELEAIRIDIRKVVLSTTASWAQEFLDLVHKLAEASVERIMSYRVENGINPGLHSYSVGIEAIEGDRNVFVVITKKWLFHDFVRELAK